MNNSNFPFFTIIIPCYNSSKTIGETINSIINQTFKDFELLIMDGQSEDDTVFIAHGFIDSRIKIYSEKDNGIYDAMNKGIALSKGKWLYFLGSDDVLFNSEVLANAFPHLNKDRELVYGNVMWGNTGKIYDGIFDLETLIKYKNICQQAIFYHKRLFAELGLFKTEYKYCADHYFNIQCFKLSRKIQYIDNIIAIYGSNGRSSNFTDNDFQQKRTLMIIEHYENPIEVYSKYQTYDGQIQKFNNSIMRLKNSKEYKLGLFLFGPLRIMKKVYKKLTN